MKILLMEMRSEKKKRLDISYCIVASKGINDQPDDGLGKARNMLLFLRYAM